MEDRAHRDVVICGGGLAGLGLARQLRLQQPTLSVAVIERVEGPLPVACVKVGESTVEVGTHYLGEVLQLWDYLKARHFRKLGLRYFLGDSQAPLQARPELGHCLYPPVPSYQLDRGILENDLRRMVVADGVTLLSGFDVTDVALADDDGPHVVEYRAHGGDGAVERLSCRFVVDATGRRRLLQRKLGLSRPSPHNASAVWFRLAGRVDIDDLAPDADQSWHGRNAEERYYSTNHLMGRGYWAWLIPLSSGNTSVGIVTDESIHPYAGMSNHERASAWLARHEPSLARHIAGREPLDFLGIKGFSHSSARVFSERRWSCVGEAGVFLDPFYSPGSDFIGISNSITAQLIKLDREGRLTRELADQYNELYLNQLFESGLETYRDCYPLFGHTHIFTTKYIWDGAFYLSGSAQIFMQSMLARPELLPRLITALKPAIALHRRMQQLLREWGALAGSRDTYAFMDVSMVPFLQLLHLDMLTRKPVEQFFLDLQHNLNRLEELAQVIFFQAVKETHPGELARFSGPRWVNAWAVGLDPSRWVADGLFAPESKPRDLSVMEAMTGGVFGPREPGDELRVATMQRMMRFQKGRPFYFLVDRFIRTFVKDKRRLLRRIFVRDQARRLNVRIQGGKQHVEPEEPIRLSQPT